ncbi:MAG: LAGLIDADG family homing endonuclease [Candidatus Woesearchaeota archaeon]
MCGIIAYKGNEQASKIILEGLQNLEYRGYDSVGIATIDAGKLQVQKEIGKVQDTQLDFESMKGTMGMGHKRWAKIKYLSKQNIPITQMSKPFFRMVDLALENPQLYYVEIDENLRHLIGLKILRVSSIIDKTMISRKSLYRIMKKSGHYCRLDTLLKLGKSINVSGKTLHIHIKSVKTKNSFPITNQKLSLNEGFARILGHIIGDGGIHIVVKENKYRIFYVNNEKFLLNSFKTDVVNCFGETKIYSRQRLDHGDEVWLPSTIGSLIYRLLDFKAGNKQVPSIVMRCKNTKVVAAFLQALYDDEGFLYPSKKMIVISQVDLQLIEQIKELVSRLQIKSNKILEHNSKSRSLMYYFTITGKQDIQRFKNKIGFLHPIKSKKLSLLMKSYK